MSWPPNKATFFERSGEQGLALTYDDVRLQPGQSEYSAQEVDIASRFSRNVELKIPLVSAAMDTVTESDMAIEMAKLGGLGIIHAALEPKAQKDEVRKVKLALNGLIEGPVTFFEEQTIEEVLSECDRRGFDFRTFPIVDGERRFKGLLTQTDFDFSDDSSVRISEIMTQSQDVATSSEGTTIEEAYGLMKIEKKKTIPLLDADGRVTGMYLFSDLHRIVNDNPDNYNLDRNGRLIVGAALPTGDSALERIELMGKYVDVAVLDTAQGDSKFAFETLRQIHELDPEFDVVVGNVTNPVSVARLTREGVDGIKIGQGPGSICTTRVETGIGVPQVTAVYECAKVANKHAVPVCADGGITNPGDVPIAIAAGASSVMMGRALAGTNEAPGDVRRIDGVRVKMYRGMGSIGAMLESVSARERYGAVDQKDFILTEGIEGFVQYKGAVATIFRHYTEALRKGMSYCGSEDIAMHQDEASMFRITKSGLKESHPHDIIEQ